MPAPVAPQPWTCPRCGTVVMLKPHKMKKRKFCSRACALAAYEVVRPPRPKKQWPVKTCEWCGDDYQSKAAHQQYCSQRCMLAALHERRIDQSVEPRPCEHCGTQFRPRPGSAGRFCSRACTYAGSQGEKAAHWRGGRHYTPDGYVLIYAPDHPAARGKGGYVREHRLVMEQMLGRLLLPGENVHHRNGVKDDNRPENLELWITSQPKGQRVDEVVAWAQEIVDRYADLALTLTSGG